MNQATPPAPTSALQASASPAPVPLRAHSERCAPPPDSAAKMAPSPPSSKSVAKHRTPSRDAVAGGIAGAFAKTVVAPVERVKLLMQLRFSIDNGLGWNGYMYPSVSGRATYTSSAGRSKYKYDAWEVARLVYRDQGILAFWRGKSYFTVKCTSQCPTCIVLLSRPSCRQHAKRNPTRWYIVLEFSPPGEVQARDVSLPDMGAPTTLSARP